LYQWLTISLDGYAFPYDIFFCFLEGIGSSTVDEVMEDLDELNH
jgi:hypothetical protein